MVYIKSVGYQVGHVMATLALTFIDLFNSYMENLVKNMKQIAKLAYENLCYQKKNQKNTMIDL